MAIPLNIKTKISDMQIGDAIACRYTASLGRVGFFSELGECVATEIPVGGAASPDGLFYFIHVGYDHKGRKKLVADRNIQHSISWDTLNNSGIISGISLDKIANLFTKLANPSGLPASNGQGVSFSPDGIYLAVAHTTSPYITIYKRDGDTFAKLANPSELPASHGYGVSFSPDGTYLAVAHGTSPYITIYKRNGDTFTKLPNPSVLPASVANGVSFFPDGTYLAVAHSSFPYITIYKRDGDTFTKLPNPSGLPASSGYGVSFSPDGNYLAVAHDTSPYITIYKKDGDTFTKLANPSGLPTGTGRGVSFSPDGNYLAVAHDASPYITIYKRDGDTFAKLANPSGLPANHGYGVSFSPDGIYLAVAHTTSPYITIYKKDGDTFTKLPNPSVLPTGTGRGVSFSPNGTYLAVVHYSSPYITIYKSDGDTFTNSLFTIKLIEGGISPSDTENEWDYIIGNNTLNGLITAGDDSIWHWNVPVRSWTSTVATSDATLRVMRGGTGFASNNGVNAFVEVASGDSQAYRGFRPVLIVETLNSQPTTTTIIDKKVVYSETPHIIGEIIDENKDDPISYRVLVDGEVYLDWTTPAFSPVQVNVPLILDVGINTITFEYTDGTTEVQSWTDTVIKKDLDSFYYDGLGLVKNTASLLIGGGSVAYLKIPTSSGYLKNALLALNILEGSAGTIKIAPITSDWDSAEIESPPSVDTTKEIELEYNGTSGEVVFEFLMVTTYGIAIYSEDTELVIDVLNNTVEYEYWGTILNQPNEVTMDLVPLTWNPLIMLEGAEYQKTVVIRSTSNTFDNKTVVAELTNPNAIQYIDTDVGTGNYFYMIEVHYDITIQYSNVIEAPIPAVGFRNVLVNGEYQLKLRQGIAFDSTDVDYNFYTTPDGIKLRPLSIGNLTGGQNSDIHAFELINGYDDLNFDVTLFIYHFGAECDHDETYAYIGNADREGSVTKIGMSFTDNPFTPEYPLQFELEQGGRRIIYIKMFTAKVLTEPSTFQVTLLAYPKSYGGDNADGNTEII